MRRLVVFTSILLLIAGVAYAAENAHTEQVKAAENAGDKICPVSGEKIEENTKLQYEYKGKTYDFCCPGCLEEFKKNPEKYIRKMEKEEEGKQEHSTPGKHKHNHKHHHHH